MSRRTFSGEEVLTVLVNVGGSSYAGYPGITPVSIMNNPPTKTIVGA